MLHSNFKHFRRAWVQVKREIADAFRFCLIRKHGRNQWHSQDIVSGVRRGGGGLFKGGIHTADISAG